MAPTLFCPWSVVRGLCLVLCALYFVFGALYYFRVIAAWSLMSGGSRGQYRFAVALGLSALVIKL
jgi:hypothetical protein